MNTSPTASQKRRLPGWACLLLAAVLAMAAGCVLVYFWRVFYYLDARGISGMALTGYVVALMLLGVLAAWAVSFLKTLEARGAACVFLAGLLFCFASAPLQAPDETQHYLRAYSISTGHFDFQAERTYPEDVARLLQAFPGAWVNSHTGKGVVRDADTGEDTVYDTTGYALKQVGSEGRVGSIADGFRLYLLGKTEEGSAAPAPEPVTEPILFMILPFVPQAIGMALARVLGFGALGCLYGGRIANLLLYALLCFATLKTAQRAKPLLLAVMLLPLSLYMAASLSYDAALLGCYYLMVSFLFQEKFTGRDLAVYLAAFCWVNAAKPWLNLLWLILPLLLPKKAWETKIKKWQFALLALAGALAVSEFTIWYGNVFRFGYGTIGRMLDDVNQAAQLKFVLSNPLRFVAVLLGTLYENDFFIGQLGTFGALDLPVSFLNLSGGTMLLLGAWLSAEKPLHTLPARLGAAVWGIIYAAGAMTAMYITYTPVGMIRIIGLQARYFLPIFLLLFGLLPGIIPAAKSETDSTDLGENSRSQTTALLVFGLYAALGAVLLFQHYFIGPVYTIG